MKERKYKLLSVLLSVTLFVACGFDSTTQFNEATLKSIPGEIAYAPGYDGHLQGMATDFEKYLFWSHTQQLVKTDLKGEVLKVIDVQDHHGDLEYYRGKVYVAVNFGRFNEEPGLADSWIYVYNAKDLSFLEKYPVPEVVHGAGGIAIQNNRAMVVGGLPEKGDYNMNPVYEYNLNFDFVKRHDLQSGYTYKGIQTACFFQGHWYFACYGSTRVGVVPKVLKVKEDEKGNLVFESSYDTNMSYGMIGLDKQEFLFSNGSLDKTARKGKL